MLEQVFLHQKQYSQQLRKETLQIRLEHLTTLEKTLEKFTPEIVKALADDFQKPEAETLITEIYPTLAEIRHAKKNLARWMRPDKVRTPLVLLGTKSRIYYEPRGVCLIIGPWNYPFQLMLTPLVSALAAGNCAFLKPSEYAPQTAALIKKIITSCFSEEHVTLVEGGPEKTQELLQLPFDHIFFTGSTAVGKIVMAAASKNLSSLTLELGGKSPTLIDSSADLKTAAEKIAWAKFVNAGQTCVAPDYLLVQQSVFNEFKALLSEQLDKLYGKSPDEKKNSPDLARIINRKHAERLRDLLSEALQKEAQVFYGGDVDVESRYIAPTLIEKVEPHTKLMTEEIFGPLLPLVPFTELPEAIHFVNERPKPLALYIYSKSKLNIDTVLTETSSGGVCINDSVIHLGNSYLPFGGVGESGQGQYRGYFGFRAFSHEKAVLRQSWLGIAMRVTHPPYSKFKLDMIYRLLRWKI